MIFPLLLALLLLPAAVLAQETAAPSRAFAEAERMAQDGNSAIALEAFRQIAASNPNDHEARMWIARLHARMDNPELAAPVYESVVLEDPFNLEARLGLADALLALDDPDRALDVLEPVEDSEAQNPAVLTLLARSHAAGGRDRLSVDYYERAAVSDPTTARRVRFEAARAGYAHRLETRGFTEQEDNGTPDTRNGEIVLDYRVSDRWRVIGRGQVQRKLGISEHRIGGGAAWDWKPGLTLRGHALLGPDNLIMPEGDYLGEVAYQYHEATWLLDVRHFDFTGARTFVISPAVSLRLSDRVAVALRYAASRTVSSSLPSAQAGHTVHVRGEYRLVPRVWLYAGYAAGVDDFESFSIDRIGDFRANAISGGARLDLPTLTSVVAGYQHRSRRGNVSVGRVTLALQQAF